MGRTRRGASAGRPSPTSKINNSAGDGVRRSSRSTITTTTTPISKKVHNNNNNQMMQMTIDESFQKKKNKIENKKDQQQPQLIQIDDDSDQDKPSSSTKSSTKSPLKSPYNASTTSTSTSSGSSKEVVVGGSFVVAEKDLQLLKNFDLDSKYGPCIGITRMERYERALKFDLRPKPSPKIKAILVKALEIEKDQKTGGSKKEKDQTNISIWEQNKLLQTVF